MYLSMVKCLKDIDGDVQKNVIDNIANLLEVLFEGMGLPIKFSFCQDASQKAVTYIGNRQQGSSLNLEQSYKVVVYSQTVFSLSGSNVFVLQVLFQLPVG